MTDRTVRRSAVIEPLERRALLALTVDPNAVPPADDATISLDELYDITHTGTLVIHGTEGKDHIRVTAGKKSVSLSFGGISLLSINRSQFKRIRIEAGGGNDDVAMHGRLGKPLTINGGTGNDRLAGGIGAETINGGAGHDTIRAYTPGDSITTVVPTGTIGKILLETETDRVGSLLTGGRGDDTIIGSPGHDTIQGDAGRDIYRIETFGITTIVEPGGPLPQGDDDLTSIETTVIDRSSVGLTIDRR